MKVLHLIDSGGLYGAENMLLTLVKEQMAKGVSPMILSAGEPGAGEKALETEARRQGLPVIPWRMSPGFNLKGARDIIRWARAEGVQLLHSHGYKFNVLMGLWPERIRKIPLVTTLHGYVKAPRYTKAWLYESLDRLVLGRMRQVVLVSDSMRNEIPSRLARSPSVVVVVNGLSTASLCERAATELSSELETFLRRFEYIVLGVGRLSKEKGFDRLVAAFAELKRRYPSTGLVIIGEGKQRSELEEQLRSQGLLGDALLPGYLTEVPAMMKRADVLCMPSLTEGLPITLLEAMTLGLPIVACNVGEIGNVLGQGLGGRLIQYEGPESLANAIAATFADADTRSECTRWSEQRVERDYSGRSMVERYLDVYQRALA